MFKQLKFKDHPLIFIVLQNFKIVRKRLLSFKLVKIYYHLQFLEHRQTNNCRFTLEETKYSNKAG